MDLGLQNGGQNRRWVVVGTLLEATLDRLRPEMAPKRIQEPILDACWTIWDAFWMTVSRLWPNFGASFWKKLLTNAKSC